MKPANRIRKPDHEKAVKKSVSMPGPLFNNGEIRMRLYGLNQFSDYIQLLIRRDTAQLIKLVE